MSRQVTVELHAQARDIAGCGSADVSVPEDATGRQLKASLEAAYPDLREMLSVSALATDEEYLADGAALGGGSRFHLIPPVSGG